MSSEALANLSWLLPVGRRERMLSYRTGDSLLIRAVATTYTAHVDVVKNRSAVGNGEGSWPQPQADLPFDMVVLDSIDENLDRFPMSAHNPTVDTPGIVVSSWNLLGRLRNVAALGFSARLRRVVTFLRRAGFSAVECYYVFPSIEEPDEVVPVDAKAVLAWDEQTARSLPRRTVRRALIRAGLHSVFFADAVVIAR